MSAGQSVPVIVAAAQLANKDRRRVVTAAELAHDAVLAAAGDTPALLDRIDVVHAPPSSVFAKRSLADELGDLLGVSGPRGTGGFSGAGPLAMLAKACEAVVAGTACVVLVAGAVAEASVKHGRAQGIDVGPQAAPWSQGSGARQELPADDPRYREFMGAEVAAGVSGPGDIFALLESSFAYEAQRTPDAQREHLGALMAPFTTVAATRPDVAWFPTPRTAYELSTITSDNRMVAEPYPKRMNSFPTVDMAAAFFVTTDAMADELGIAHDQRVYPWGAGHCAEVAPPSGRPSIHRSVALHAAIHAALRGASLGAADVTAFDLYSCFPAAVQMSLQALDIAPADPRPFTLTGGLPYFGGPGANYVTHAIVAAVERCRGAAGERALVVGIGGAPSDFGAAVLAATPPHRPWTIARCADVQAQLASERVPVDNTREGRVTVDAMTVIHDREQGPTHAALIGRYPDGVRTGARAVSESVAAELAGTSLVGAEATIRQIDGRPVFIPD